MISWLQKSQLMEWSKSYIILSGKIPGDFLWSILVHQRVSVVTFDITPFKGGVWSWSTNFLEPHLKWCHSQLSKFKFPNMHLPHSPSPTPKFSMCFSQVLTVICVSSSWHWVPKSPGVPKVDLLLLRSGSIPVAEVERWLKKWIWIPWDSSAFFYHHFGWNGWNILFQFFFPSIVHNKQIQVSWNHTWKESKGIYQFDLWISMDPRCFRDTSSGSFGG